MKINPDFALAKSASRVPLLTFCKNALGYPRTWDNNELGHVLISNANFAINSTLHS